MVDGVVEPQLLGAVGLLATPAVAVDVDVAVRGGRARAWHRLGDRGVARGRPVAALSSRDGLVFELAWTAADRWGDELARVAGVPDLDGSRPSAVPPGLDLPFELLESAGEALGSGRADLLPVLVAQHSGAARDADGTVLTDAEVATALGSLALECRGRLRALVSRVGDRAPVGVVSWVLVADGWRELRGRAAASPGEARVAVVAAAPRDLGASLAPVLRRVG